MLLQRGSTAADGTESAIPRRKRNRRNDGNRAKSLLLHQPTEDQVCFTGLEKKSVKALSFPYLCEPTAMQTEDCCPTTDEEWQFQTNQTSSHEGGARAWANFVHAKETQLLL